MRKSIASLVVLIVLLAVSALPRPAPAIASPLHSTAGELIDAVNALRAKQGLPPYQVNAILMSVAQAHADYMASIQVSTVHTDADGLRPYQRALAAGYPVAGDLSQGGWYSENVTGGAGLTAGQAVQQWMKDAAHQGTMLSAVLQDVGAGVTVSGTTVYYCLDAALSTGGTPVAYTPPPPLISPTPTIVMSTPNPDGSIVHVIQPGDTLYAIAIAYGVSVNDIYNLNNINAKTIIYAGRKLTIRAANTPTPALPSPTPSQMPTETLWPTSAATDTGQPPTPSPTAAAGMDSSKAQTAVAAIFLGALIIAGAVTAIGSRRRK